MKSKKNTNSSSDGSPAPGRTFLNKKNILILSLSAALLILIVLSVVLFNHWKINISLNGDKVMEVEYGKTFKDPGAKAVMYGKYLFKNGFSKNVTASGSVNTKKLGTYNIKYSAGGLLCNGSVSRKVTVKDTTPPEIKLTTVKDSYTLPNHPYEEEGYKAVDLCDGDITDKVIVTDGDGTKIYTVTDSSGNTATVTRKINYFDPSIPVLTLKGEASMTVNAGIPYREPGFQATDQCDGDITDKVVIDNPVDIYSPGDYVIKYSVKDTYGNEAKAERKVSVVPSPQSGTINPGSKIVYLTFDDGPGPYTQKLLEILDKYNVKATFFVVNGNYNDLITAEAAAGHTVAIHTASHNYQYIYSSTEAYFDDMNQMKRVIEQYTGTTPTLLRFPGGSSNTLSKKYCPGIMTELTNAVTSMGYKYFDWNVSSGDAGDTKSTEQVYQNVINGIKNHDVSIVLQHDIKGFSVDAVEKIITWGLANGYTFLPLDGSSPVVHHPVCN